MTKKAYLFVFSDVVGTQEHVKTVLNQIPSIEDWRYDLEHAFYLISEQSAQQLTDEIRSRTNNKGRFIVTEVPDNSYGWLTPESWYLIQNKRRKPK